MSQPFIVVGSNGLLVHKHAILIGMWLPSWDLKVVGDHDGILVQLFFELLPAKKKKKKKGSEKRKVRKKKKGLKD